MNERQDHRNGPGQSAAEWYVDLDAEPADGAAESELAAWLGCDERNEAGFERCEAAVQLAARLESDPDLGWAFAEARALAAAGPARRRRRRRGQRGAWALAAGIAAAAIVVALRPSAPERPVPTVAATGVSTPIADAGGDASLLERRSPISRVLLDEAVASTAAGALPGQVVVDASSVAVLPFVNLSRNPADGSVVAHFDAGLAAELHADIVAELGEQPGIDVINRHAVMPYAGLELPPDEVAADLGVRGVVRGGLRSENGTVEVDIELVDAVDGTTLWEMQESRPAAELDTVRAEVVTAVAAALADVERRITP